MEIHAGRQTVSELPLIRMWTGRWEIYVINVNGGKPKRLTNNPASDTAPSWSRDGRWIYFLLQPQRREPVWKVPADGGEAVRVTRKGGALALESLDSQWIYYTKPLV